MAADMLSRILARPPGDAALRLQGRTVSYGDLIARASALAGVIASADCGPTGVVGLLAARSLTAYSGALAAHLAGRGYLPLHPRFPVERTRTMLACAGTRVLIVGREGLPALAALLAQAPAPLTIVGPELDGFEGLEDTCPDHRFLPGALLPDQGGLPGSRPPASAAAYLLFTSGSTGTPKGVPVSFGNLESYVAYMGERTALTAADRTSQTFEMTFDLSVHDLFVTWSAGACLCPLTEGELLAPARFIRDAGLTVWFSVPSVPMLMKRTRTLTPGVFPDLRLSLFCGEPLPESIAATWAAAAPRGALINLYGPTEATIAIAEYAWTPDGSGGAARHGVVPLGRLFPGHRGALLGEDETATEGQGRGELCLCGPQVTAGYLNDPERTARQYVALPGLSGGPWYRTGDVVERDGSGCLYFLGRVDSQIKLNGHRIELQEIDHVLRAVSGTDLAVTVAWPVTEEGVRGLVGCVGAPADAAALLAGCRERLPDYMVPARIVFPETLPLNSNGKIDRKALFDLLESGRL